VEAGMIKLDITVTPKESMQ